MPFDLSDVRLFGSSDASLPVEKEGLRDYFVEPPGFRAVVDGYKTIISGRKGTGKSAIRTKLLGRPNEISINLEPLVPNHRVFGEYARTLTSSGKADYATYDLAWRAYVVAACVHHLAHHRLLGFDQPETLRKSARQAGAPRPSALVERVPEISKAYVSLSSASGDEQNSNLPRETEIPFLLGAIEAAAISSGTRVLVLMDRIDQQLEHPLRGELYLQYVKYLGGACSAAAFIAGNSSRRALSFYVFAREDIMERVWTSFHNSTEFRGLVHQMTWRTDSLMDMLAVRLATFLEVKYDTSWAFEKKRSVFLSKRLLFTPFKEIRLDGYPMWHWIMLHSNMNPRDVLDYCLCCRDEAIGSGKERIDGNAINRGTHRYSRLKYQSLIATLRWRITYFSKIVDSFKGGPLRFDRQGLVEHLGKLADRYHIEDVASKDSKMTPDHLIALLYGEGFLVAPRESDERVPFVAVYLDPYRATDQQDVWMIHPAFLRALRRGAKAPDVRAHLQHD